MAVLYYLSQYFTTTLSVVGGIDASQTTDIVLQSVTGINDTTKPGIALLNYADPLNESIAEWVTFTSINSTTKTLVGVTRGAEKGSGKTHSNGVTVAFPISESHINNIITNLVAQHNATTGVHDSITGTSAFPKVYGVKDLGTVGATETVSWANGDRQKMTLDENLTITFSNAAEGQTLTLYMLQDGSGTNTITWADTITWQDGITWGTTYYTTTASKMNIAVITYVGSAYYGVISKFA